MQPKSLVNILGKESQFYSFILPKSDFDDQEKIMKTLPRFHKYSFGFKALSENVTGPLRIVVTSDYISGEDPLISFNAEKLKFSKYTSSETNEEFFISEPIKKFHEIAATKNSPLFKKFVTLLIVEDESSKKVVNYDFSSSYSGWHFIVFPFISFLKGLAAVPGKYVPAKLAHLSQSSGYGKTRLCFEALRHESRGIYSVYRSNSEGYPSTTPWMKDLYIKFTGSRSDEESLNICRRFIANAVIQFGEHQEHTMDIFEGKAHKEIDLFQFNANQSNSQENISEKIVDTCNNLFLMVFDECHELLVTPTNLPFGLSLYRCLRRVLFEIKNSGVVAVFLGTKSSLGDFVLNSHRDPSTRRSGDDVENGFDVPLYVFTQSTNAMLTEPVHITYQDMSKVISVGKSFICVPDVLKHFTLKCGRPLWSFLGSFEEAYEVALNKLKCERSLFELTCFILRTGSSVVPQDELAHKLVLSGMATLLHVDVDGSRCWMEYVPEPILSNVARNVLLDIKGYAKAIKEYVKRLQLGAFHETGIAGEFVGRVVLLRAMDLALLKPEISINADRENALNLISSTLFANNVDCESDFRKECENLFSQTVLKGEAASEKTSSASNIESNLYISPKLGITTLKEFLLMLSSACEVDFSNFGVSDAVLNGLVSFNQFIQLENPLNINQPYLLHGFVRFVAFILPFRAPGIDIVIPVLRTDNKMSCIAIQIKNYSSEAFPCGELHVSSKLSYSYMKFLDFGAVGDFEAAPSDDFVRIVLQFHEKKTSNDSPSALAAWSNIPGSVSNSSVTQNTGANCQALWLLGLDVFEKSLFFNNSEIIKDLNTILSGQRNFLNALDYPVVKRPTALQTTVEGAQFLADSARVMSNYNNLIVEDGSLRINANSKTVYQNYCETLKDLSIPEFSKDYQSKFTVTTKMETINKVSTGTISEISEEERKKITKQLLNDIAVQNKAYMGPATDPQIQTRKRKISAENPDAKVSKTENESN